MLKIYEIGGSDYKMLIECIPPILTITASLAKYFNGMIQVKKIVQILMCIKNDSDRLVNLPEHDVLHHYAIEGRKTVTSFAVTVATMMITYLTLPTSKILHDIITKRNKSEERDFMYHLEFYFDQQEHYYLVMLHSYVASVSVIFLVGALDTMYILFAHHACAMFAVTGYRLKTVHILNMNDLREGKDLDRFKNKEFTEAEQRQIYKKLVVCIKEHKRTLEFTELVQSAFTVTLFIQIMLNIVSLSLTGFSILLNMGKNWQAVLRLSIWEMGQVMHLFFLCMPGQILTNFSERLYDDSLECMWYMFSKKSQILYQFLIMNCLKPSKLTALKITSLSFETFLSVTQTAVSYFTVLSSTL